MERFTSVSDIAKIDREEMAIDEAELEPDEFTEKMENQQKLQEQVYFVTVSFN